MFVGWYYLRVDLMRVWLFELVFVVFSLDLLFSLYLWQVC